MDSLKDALREAAGEGEVKSVEVADTGESTSVEPAAQDVENEKTVKHKSISTELRSQFQKADKETKLSKTPEAKAPVAVEASTQAFEPIAPPADLKKELVEEFNKLPPNLQKWISQRSYEYRSDYGRQTQELRAIQDRYRAYDEALKPYEQEYVRKGINPADVVRRSIAWDNFFNENPLEAAKQWLTSYGIDPSELMQGEQQPQQNQQYLTQEQAAQIAEERAQQLIEERFNRIEQERYIADASNVINSFIGSKPLFKDPGTAVQVEEAMAPILQALRAAEPQAPIQDLLETAYAVATTRNPQLAQLVQRLNATTEVERVKENALKAQHASRSIAGSPGSGSPSTKPKTISEELRMRFSGAL